MKCTIVFSLILLGLCLCQAAPAPQNSAFVITSATDITGQSVRQARQSNGQEDYFICYPSSVVYGNNNRNYNTNSNPSFPNNIANTHRRSGEVEPSRPLTFQEKQERADRAREAYTDSFGK